MMEDEGDHIRRSTQAAEESPDEEEDYIEEDDYPTEPPSPPISYAKKQPIPLLQPPPSSSPPCHTNSAAGGDGSEADDDGDDEEEEEDDENDQVGDHIRPVPHPRVYPPANPTPEHDPTAAVNEHHDSDVEEARPVEDPTLAAAESTTQTPEMDTESSVRKTSVVDSLATTATVYRNVDKTPARITTVRSLSLLYAIFLAALGAVFPLAFFLSGRTREAGMCFTLLHIYATLLSIVFIIYINIAIWRQKRHERLLLGQPTQDDEEGGQDRSGTQEAEKYTATIEGNGYVACSDPAPSPSPGSREGASSPCAPNRLPSEESRTRTLETTAAGHPRILRVGQSEEGVNWFLRLGLIAFGMGSMVLDGFRLVQFAEINIALKCLGLLVLVATALRLLFTFAQTFFLFKNHRVIIHFGRCSSRFILLHLAATNVCAWIMTVIWEGTSTYVQYQYNMESQDELLDVATNTTAAMNVTSTQPMPSILDWLIEDMPPLSCFQRKSLASEASPYLFPCVIEYSLLAIAVLCRMYVNVGRIVIAREESVEAKDPVDSKGKGTLECHKANSGLFLGLFVFTLVCIAMLFFLLYESGGRPMASTITGLVYYGGDISVNVIGIIALAPAFAQMRKLHFSQLVVEVFNENLMYVSLAGFYLLVGLMIIPALMSIYVGGLVALLSELQAISCILSVIQASVQVVFIFDGLRRRAATRTHFRSKPGRSLITFLLICNVSMWVINTFELKEAITADLFINFYGSLPWILLIHVALPLTIFFRFHSTVCLSDMWGNAYKRPGFVTSRPMSSDKQIVY